MECGALGQHMCAAAKQQAPGTSKIPPNLLLCHADLTAAPSKDDPIVSKSNLFGRPNLNDSVWHDDTWAHHKYGPISRLTLYKAWYYDGLWHNPGELKGIQVG